MITVLSRSNRTALGLATTVACLIGISTLAVNAVGRAGNVSDGGAAAAVRGVLQSGGGVAPAVATSTSTGADHGSATGVEAGPVAIGEVTTDARATRTPIASSATGRVMAADLRIFNGRVVIDRIELDVVARASLTDARVELRTLSIPRAQLDGVAMSLTPGTTLQVPGAGVIHVGETASDGPGDLRVNALRIVADDPAVAEVTIGHLDVAAASGPEAVRRPQPAVAPTLDPDAAAAPQPADPPAAEIPGKAAAPDAGTPASRAGGSAESAPHVSYENPPVLVTPAPRLLPGTPDAGAAGITRGPGASGRAFPVLGETWFGDDYGAPRAGTGWHHGVDIFGATGTPVVAVADGTLSKIGWNTLGGNRLWLTDGQGTSYYYAHLSAYAPAAVEGGAVRAGEVIAYLGNTGQASTTPPHLHLEMHPGGIDANAVNPYPFLVAWQSGTLALVAGPTVPQADVAPDAAAGAVVVQVERARDGAPGRVGSVATSAR